jgi:hypothetical protein
VATTAIGLYARMHDGEMKEHESLERGLKFLEAAPVREGNMYFSYYASKAFQKHGGPAWERWRTRMHEQLAASQEQAGVAGGSWYFKGVDHGSERGGRLYCTSLATLILQLE